MKVYVAKEEDSKLHLMVVSQGTPPLPAVVLKHLELSEVADRVASVLADFKRARTSLGAGPSL